MPFGYISISSLSSTFMCWRGFSSEFRVSNFEFNTRAARLFVLPYPLECAGLSRRFGREWGCILYSREAVLPFRELEGERGRLQKNFEGGVAFSKQLSIDYQYITQNLTKKCYPPLQRKNVLKSNKCCNSFSADVSPFRLCGIGDSACWRTTLTQSPQPSEGRLCGEGKLPPPPAAKICLKIH